MSYPRQRRFVFFGGTSGESSTYTSTPRFIGEFGYLAVSYHTDVAAASRLTLQGSNDDGFQAAITNWSNLTAIVTPGLYSVTPGVRWIRALRGSGESLSISELQARV